MRRALVLMCLWGCEDPADANAPVEMTPERHCELAAQLAEDGDCLAAGEHLAFCTGAAAASARATAHVRCPVKREPVPTPTQPTVVETAPTAQPPIPVAPPVPKVRLPPNSDLVDPF